MKGQKQVLFVKIMKELTCLCFGKLLSVMQKESIAITTVIVVDDDD